MRGGDILHYSAMAKSLIAPGARSYAWWVLAGAVLAAGYADLLRGGITIGPILLVIGYCILVPIAILK